MTVMNETDTETSASIIKTDTRGRARYTAEFKADVVAECEKSGMSVLAFSRHCGVNYATLQSWIKKRREDARKPRDSAGSPSFVLAGLIGDTPAPRSGEIVIELPGGTKASAIDEGGVRLLAVLVRELAR